MEINPNVRSMEAELRWFSAVLDVRMKLYFGEGCEYNDVEEVPAPNLDHDPSIYAQIIRSFRFSRAERLVVILALVPHIMPQMLDVFFTKNKLYDRGYTEFGGAPSTYFQGFLPTAETAVFLVAGSNLAKRVRVMSFFDDGHSYKKYNILKLDQNGQEKPETPLSGVLRVTDEYMSYFIQGKPFRPNFTSNFPAQRISTQLDWEDLVFQDHVYNEIQNIILWLENRPKIMEEWGLSKFIKPGYRALFYGPPGTGKTLTASLIGKYSKREVYKIDLSQVISKYIGDTEKNLANIFDTAEHKDWILFFDEADALFGKRTQSTSNFNEQHLNQQIGYLLQRIEDYDGVVILATNLKDNIDQAFQRRFQAMIYFEKPGAEQRFKLWIHAFSKLKVEDGVDFQEISSSYDLAGGSIINVLRYCALLATKSKGNTVTLKTILDGIKKEYIKDGITVA
ncbi:MAG: ATP-binding protein [Cytophagales bacterium]|nr:ATP-binding protein [Cytophagales bacterium]